MGYLIFFDNFIDVSITYSSVVTLLTIHYNYLLGNVNQEDINLNSSENLLSYLREEKPSVLKRRRKR